MNITAYNAARNNAAALIRHDRGLIEVTGADRAKWLNNLITNVVLTLQPGDGNYAFVINVKGRTQFDLNLLIRPDAILLDIDRRLIDKASKFLDRYNITEQVTLRDRSADAARLLVVGPQAHAVATTLGFPNLTPMAWLQHVEGRLGDSQAIMFRHDLVGLPGAEFILFGEHAASDATTAVKKALDAGALELDAAAFDCLRIEAGIPKSVDDIDEEVIPPETGQVERGINYRKGCYLGQEVIERMRAHNVLARELVAIRIDGDTPLPPGTPLLSAGAEGAAPSEVGRSMSSCISPALNMSPLSLAYVKTAAARPGVSLIAQTANGPRRAEIVPSPIRAS